MSDVLFRGGFYGCAHLGYRMVGMARAHPSGANIREIDGYATYELVMRDMLDAGVDFISDGGDLFHVHKPSPRAIDEALRIDDLRVDANRGVRRITNTGNHDKSTGAHTSAIAAVHRPQLGSHSVYPRPNAATGEALTPHPGLYEVHQPIPGEPLYLHVVSDFGLDDRLRDAGIVIDPRPVPDATNILVSHGIFTADDRLFGAVNGHGGHRLIPSEWVDRGFDASVLSDYHTPGPISGYGPADRSNGHVWMTGSLIGRGFSDDICRRGWLLVDVLRSGQIQITPRTVWMRPQRDFEAIDCTHQTVDAINQLVRTRLAEHDWWDDESAQISGDGGWLLRQRFQHATPTQRHALRALAGEWATAAGRAAYWNVSFDTTSLQRTGDAPCRRRIGRDTTAINFVDDFTSRHHTGRVGAVLAGASPAVRESALGKVTKALSGL